MAEAQPTRCSFMIGSEVIQLTPNKNRNRCQTENRHNGLLEIDLGSDIQLNPADSAWLTEILLTRRRHLSAPVFSAAAHRRYSASKRRLLRRSLPPIAELESPIYDDDDDDYDEGCCGSNSEVGSGSEPSSPTLSASSSASSSSSGSDEDDFVQKWNKITSPSKTANHHHHHHVPHLSHRHHFSSTNNPSEYDSPSSSCQSVTTPYYQLFDGFGNDENDGVNTRQHCNDNDDDDDDSFAADLSRRLEFEAAAKRKDAGQQRFSLFNSNQTDNFVNKNGGIIGHHLSAYH